MGGGTFVGMARSLGAIPDRERAGAGEQGIRHSGATLAPALQSSHYFFAAFLIGTTLSLLVASIRSA